MPYYARRDGTYDKQLEQEVHNQKNANNIRNAANVAIASKNPYAMAAGGAVKAGDKLSDGKVSEGLGKALGTANKNTPGGKNIQEALDTLNDSGLSDKLGDAAFAYHKYMDYTNNTMPNQHSNQMPNQVPSKETQQPQLSKDDDDYQGEGSGKGNMVAKVIIIALAITLAPLFLILAMVISATTTHNSFEDALGSSYANGETIGGYVEIAKTTKDAEKFYERIAEVREELAEEGMMFESVKIIAVYNVMTNENKNFTYKKMTKAKITEIAKAMFREGKDSNGNKVYIYDEELFKQNLKDKIYKKQFLLYSDKKREEMAKNTIDYIKDYYAYLGVNPSSAGNVSSGKYTTWRQDIGPWTSVNLGSSGKSIQEIGCAATSVSILIAKSGAKTTVSELNPGTFVQKLNQNGGFGTENCAGCINWDKASSVAPTFKFSGKTTVIDETKEQKLAILNQLLSNGYYVTAEVKGRTGEHWVAIDAIKNGNIIMIDPGSNGTDLWKTYPWQNTGTYVYYKVA